MDMKNMKCFYLDNTKKRNSKSLYQSVFTEDSRDFVDYYYEHIGTRNKILAIEKADDSCIIAMLHQNPHHILIGQAQLKTEYIYGVAVSEQYRHRGYMSKMIKMALRNIFEEKICFTYLFPVSKGLYEKFGFGYVGSLPSDCQLQMKEMEKNAQELQGILCSISGKEEEWKEAEAFIREDFQSRQGIYLMQSVSYLKEWMEMSRRNGEQSDLFIYRKQNKIKAILKVTDDIVIEEIGDKKEIKEAFYLWARLSKQNAEISTEQYTKQNTEQYTEQNRKQSTPPSTELPAMVRILHLEKLLCYISFPEELDITFFITDDVFLENQGIYRVHHGKGEKTQGAYKQKMHIRDFTQWLFSFIPFQIKDQI